MAITVDPTEKLEIMRTIKVTLDLTRRRFGRFAALWGLTVLACVLLGTILVLAAGTSLLPQIMSGHPPKAEMILRIWPIFALGLLGLVLLGAIEQAAGLHVALEEIAGRQTTLEENIRFGLRKALPTLGLTLLLGLAYLCGLILLIVPGIMILIALSAALPAALTENLGIVQAFRRSRDLTRNNRWRILGFWLVVGISIVLVELVLAILTGGLTRNPDNLGTAIIGIALSLAESMVVSALSISGIVALYTELRRIRDLQA
ncbi:MAG: hypothetical protein WCO83_08050 [Alphaproteobacteria bacterium]